MGNELSQPIPKRGKREVLTEKETKEAESSVPVNVISTEDDGGVYIGDIGKKVVDTETTVPKTLYSENNNHHCHQPSDKMNGNVVGHGEEVIQKVKLCDLARLYSGRKTETNSVRQSDNEEILSKNSSVDMCNNHVEHSEVRPERMKENASPDSHRQEDTQSSGKELDVSVTQQKDSDSGKSSTENSSLQNQRTKTPDDDLPIRPPRHSKLSKPNKVKLDIRDFELRGKKYSKPRTVEKVNDSEENSTERVTDLDEDCTDEEAHALEHTEKVSEIDAIRNEKGTEKGIFLTERLGETQVIQSEGVEENSEIQMDKVAENGVIPSEKITENGAIYTERVAENEVTCKESTTEDEKDYTQSPKINETILTENVSENTEILMEAAENKTVKAETTISEGEITRKDEESESKPTRGSLLILPHEREPRQELHLDHDGADLEVKTHLHFLESIELDLDNDVQSDDMRKDIKAEGSAFVGSVIQEESQPAEGKDDVTVPMVVKPLRVIAQEVVDSENIPQIHKDSTNKSELPESNTKHSGGIDSVQSDKQQRESPNLDQEKHEQKEKKNKMTYNTFSRKVAAIWAEYSHSDTITSDTSQVTKPQVKKSPKVKKSSSFWKYLTYHETPKMRKQRQKQEQNRSSNSSNGQPSVGVGNAKDTGQESMDMNNSHTAEIPKIILIGDGEQRNSNTSSSDAEQEIKRVENNSVKCESIMLSAETEVKKEYVMTVDAVPLSKKLAEDTNVPSGPEEPNENTFPDELVGATGCEIHCFENNPVESSEKSETDNKIQASPQGSLQDDDGASSEQEETEVHMRKKPGKPTRRNHSISSRISDFFLQDFKRKSTTTSAKTDKTTKQTKPDKRRKHSSSGSKHSSSSIESATMEEAPEREKRKSKEEKQSGLSKFLSVSSLSLSSKDKLQKPKKRRSSSSTMNMTGVGVHDVLPEEEPKQRPRSIFDDDIQVAIDEMKDDVISLSSLSSDEEGKHKVQGQVSETLMDGKETDSSTIQQGDDTTADHSANTLVVEITTEENVHDSTDVVDTREEIVEKCSTFVTEAVIEPEVPPKEAVISPVLECAQNEDKSGKPDATEDVTIVQVHRAQLESENASVYVEPVRECAYATIQHGDEDTSKLVTAADELDFSTRDNNQDSCDRCAITTENESDNEERCAVLSVSSPVYKLISNGEEISKFQEENSVKKGNSDSNLAACKTPDVQTENESSEDEATNCGYEIVSPPPAESINEQKRKRLGLIFQESKDGTHEPNSPSSDEEITRTMSLEELHVQPHIYDEIENKRPVIYRRFSDKDERNMIRTAPDGTMTKRGKKKKRSLSFSDLFKRRNKQRRPKRKSKDESWRKMPDTDSKTQPTSPTSSIVHM